MRLQDFITILRPASVGAAVVYSAIVFIDPLEIPIWTFVVVFSLVLNVGMLWANRGSA